MMGFRSLTRICFYLLTSISFATWILSMLLTHSHYVTMLKATLRPKIVLQKEKNKPLSRTGMFKQYLHNEYNITMDTFERWTNTSNLAARMTDRSNVWQLAGKPDQIFVYSAYYQETYLSKKSILIIGLMRKDMNRMVKMSSCIYWYDDSSFSYRKVPVESVNVLGQHHFTKYVLNCLFDFVSRLIPLRFSALLFFSFLSPLSHFKSFSSFFLFMHTQYTPVGAAGTYINIVNI